MDVYWLTVQAVGSVDSLLWMVVWGWAALLTVQARRRPWGRAVFLACLATLMAVGQFEQVQVVRSLGDGLYHWRPPGWWQTWLSWLALGCLVVVGRPSKRRVISWRSLVVLPLGIVAGALALPVVLAVGATGPLEAGRPARGWLFGGLISLAATVFMDQFLSLHLWMAVRYLGLTWSDGASMVVEALALSCHIAAWLMIGRWAVISVRSSRRMLTDAVSDGTPADALARPSG